MPESVAAQHALQEQLLDGLNHLQTQQVPGISSEQQSGLLHYLDMLAKWNRVYNLTAVRQVSQMVDRHLLDSLVLSRWLSPQSEASQGIADVMDVGSGAGLPVIPLAIARPDLSFVSIESNGKKTRFQQQAILELGLTNVELINDRVENVNTLAGMVVSRAFTAPEQFLHIAHPLTAEAGRVVIMLGLAERFPEVVPTGFTLEELVNVTVPGTDSARHVAVCRRH